MRKTNWFIIISLFSFIACIPGKKESSVTGDIRENFHLFLLAGQSNMAGRGTIPNDDKKIHPRIFMLSQNGKWKPALDPIHYDKKIAGAGLAKSFALSLVDLDSTLTIGLIPAACGGSPIASWQPGKFFEATNSHPYDDAVARTKRAMKDGVLKGILWHQGESDCNPENAPFYKERLINLIKRFREDLDANEVPFIIGQLGQFPGKPWDDSIKEINKAQISTANEMEFVCFVSSVGLLSKSDTIHFDTKSLREFGRRYAKKYLEIERVKNGILKIDK